MRIRKIRYVADSCPLKMKRKNCDTCRYCNGIISNGTVYCYYGDKNWMEGGKQ